MPIPIDAINYKKTVHIPWKLRTSRSLPSTESFLCVQLYVPFLYTSCIPFPSLKLIAKATLILKELKTEHPLAAVSYLATQSLFIDFRSIFNIQLSTSTSRQPHTTRAAQTDLPKVRTTSGARRRDHPSTISRRR